MVVTGLMCGDKCVIVYKLFTGSFSEIMEECEQ